MNVPPPKEHNDKDAVSAMTKQAEYSLFTTLRTARSKLIHVCRDRLRRQIPTLGVLWLDPFLINEVMLHTYSGCDIVNMAKQRLLIDLASSNLLRLNVLQNILVEERLMSYVCTTSNESLQTELFDKALESIKDILHEAINITFVEQQLERTFRYKNWSLQKVVLGTQYDKRYWIDTNDFFDSTKDADGTRHYNKPCDKMFRRTEVFSKVYTHVYFHIEIPITYYFILPDGRKYGSTIHVVILEISLAEDWKMLEKMLVPTSIDSYKLPALTLYGHFLQKTFMFNNPFDNDKLHGLAFYAIMSYMHEVDNHIPMFQKVVNLSMWNILEKHHAIPFLDGVSSIIRTCVQRLTTAGDQQPLHKVYGFTHGYKVITHTEKMNATKKYSKSVVHKFTNGIFAYPADAFVINFQFVASSVLRAFKISIMVNNSKSLVSFITPDTIE